MMHARETFCNQNAGVTAVLHVCNSGAVQVFNQFQ